MNMPTLRRFLGTRHAALVPSAHAVGTNTYLTTLDFWKMLGAALLVHTIVFVIASVLPNEKVTNIPVRALSFKLGDRDQVAAYAPVAAPVAAPVMQAVANTESWRATPQKSVPVTPPPLKPVVKPQSASAKVAPVKQPKTYKVEELAPLPTSAIVPVPQQYVREVGAPSPQAVAAAMAHSGAVDGAMGGQAAQTMVTQQSMQAIRARYEQEISGWIQQHKYYPADAGGHEGRAIVRMRIDRAGNVRYYAIEQSAGLPALDTAALEMIRRANPVPAVPAEYPAGNLVEFLIPITFKAPS